MAINSLESLEYYLINTNYDIIFIHLTANGLLNANVPLLISNANAVFRKSYVYIAISNSTVNNFYLSQYNKLPALLTFKRKKYNYAKFWQPYYITTKNNTINNFIRCSLEINSLQTLQDHFKFITYTIVLIRLYKYTTLKTEYIQYLINVEDKLNNKNYDYIDLDIEEVNRFYLGTTSSIMLSLQNYSVPKTYDYNVKSLPAFLSFRKDTDGTWLVCRRISGDEIYQIKHFISSTLKLSN
jgi:hypothetical protein